MTTADKGDQSTPAPISEAELQRRMPKRKLGFLPWAIVAFIALIVMPISGYVAWLNSARQRFDQRMQELAKSGRPIDAQSMDAYYVLPEGAIDSTRFYLSAISTVSSKEYGNDAQDIPLVSSYADTAPLPGQPWPDLAKSKEFLERNESISLAAHTAAAQGGHARYPIDFRDGFMTLLPHVNDLPQLVVFLELEAMVKAHEQDSAGVARAICSSLTAIRSLENEPIIVSQLSSHARLDRVMSSLERLLPTVEFADDELEQIQLALRSFDIRRSTRKVFVGELGMCLVALTGRDTKEQLRGTELFQDNLGGQTAFTLANWGTRYDDLILYSQCMDQFLSATELPWPEAIHEVEKVLQQTRASTEGTFREMRFALTRTCLKIPSYPSAVFVQAARTETQLRLADLLIAAKRFHTARGELAQEAAQLAPNFIPQVPDDPFAPGSSLTISKIANGIRVSSRGFTPSDQDSSDPFMPVQNGVLQLELGILP